MQVYALRHKPYYCCKTNGCDRNPAPVSFGKETGAKTAAAVDLPCSRAGGRGELNAEPHAINKRGLSHAAMFSGLGHIFPESAVFGLVSDPESCHAQHMESADRPLFQGRIQRAR